MSATPAGAEGSAHFRSDAALMRAPLRPRHPAPGESGLALLYNRIGGLLERMGRVSGIDPAAALAVWAVESSAAPFVRGRPILRFENHVFFARWGKDHESDFDCHFRFGSRGDVAGSRWEQHRFRAAPRGEWQRFHGDQSLEYQAFALAQRLAGRETACLSASVGGPQIMGFNHAVVGYANAAAMFAAFARSERWQVLGFFDFCKAKDLVPAIRQHRWHDFAAVYNGPGNAAAYAAKIAAAFDEARSLRR